MPHAAEPIRDGPPDIHELDINPLLVYPRGKGATRRADARIILSKE